jgi:hypothetical protein
MGFHEVPWDSMRFHGIPWSSMRFYDVPVNRSVPTEANRSLTSYSWEYFKKDYYCAYATVSVATLYMFFDWLLS